MFLSKCIYMGVLPGRLHAEQSVEDFRTGSLESGQCYLCLSCWIHERGHVLPFVQVSKILIVFSQACRLSLENH